MRCSQIQTERMMCSYMSSSIENYTHEIKTDTMDKRKLLIVDDEPRVIASLLRELRDADYQIHTAEDGTAGLEILKKEDIGVILSDLVMSEMDGLTFLSKAKSIRPEAIQIILTGHASLNLVLKAINESKVYYYLTKPWSIDILKSSLTMAFERHVVLKENRRLQQIIFKQNVHLRHSNTDLEKIVEKRTLLLQEAVREGILLLARAAEAKDDITGNHIQRIYDLSLRICLKLGIPEQEANEIAYSSMMHDIGKIYVPDCILKKPGKLTEEERCIMKEHTIMGDKILGDKPFYKTAREIARNHHERWDGTGYPDGLVGEGIPFSARVVAVADIFDALTSERPYKPAWDTNHALEEMKKLSGKVFEPKMLEAFLELGLEADRDVE